MSTKLGELHFVSILITAILYGSPLLLFLDVPSILLILGTMGFLAVCKFSLKEFLSFSDQVILSLINFSLLAGGIGFIIGLVQMLQNMADPSKIGPAIALSLLTVLYSLIIAAGLYAIKRGVTSRSIGVVAVAGSLATLLPVVIMMLSFGAR